MAKRVRGYKAWLIRWEWAGDHAKIDEPIIAILPPRTTPADVKRFVERYYAATMYILSEKLLFMRRPNDNPYIAQFGTTPVTLEDGSEGQVTWDSEVLCGHNPYIVATRVTDLRVLETEGDLERLEWKEVPRPHLDLRRRER